ncbi:glycosyltransferase [Paenibacillus silviterrae]|uniref:glycosyltransferase n=1 Tax=Paenibacillus silviterrae TaxID=3242194 RepID=UPI002543AE37|nr:glycosyltransferase [Paenibacillus chinjuensis]
MRICMLIRRHSFLDARVFEKEARSLAKMGHFVTIMAPKHRGHLLTIANTPNLDKAFQKERFVHEGIAFSTYNANQITDKKQVALMQQSMLQNINNGERSYFVDSLWATALHENADVYIAHEWETLYEAIQIKRWFNKRSRRVKIIFDAHELEDDNLLLKSLMREVDHIITVSDSLKNIYARRYPNIPITIIYNSPPFQEQAASFVHKNKGLTNPGTSFTIAYEGKLSKKKGDPYKIVEIVNLLNKSGMKVKFKILGNVSMANKLETEEVITQLRSHPSIEYGWVDFKDLPQHWANVDAGYIFFDLSNQNRVHALPNKFFSYLNSGTPVVVNAAAEMERFVTKHQCGIVIKKKNPTAADYAVHFLRLHRNRKLLNQLSLNAREIMRKSFSWEKMGERLFGIMKSLK